MCYRVENILWSWIIPWTEEPGELWGRKELDTTERPHTHTKNFIRHIQCICVIHLKIDLIFYNTFRFTEKLNGRYKDFSYEHFLCKYFLYLWLIHVEV